MSRKLITLSTLAKFKELYDSEISSEIQHSIDGNTIVLDEDLKFALNDFLRGGYLVVETVQERDQIPTSLLKRGSLVKVSSSDIVYEFDGVNWKKTATSIKSLGNGLVLSADGVLSVDTTDEAEANNAQPMSSNGVYLILGDITDRLEDI